MATIEASWETKAAAKRAEALAKIPSEWRLPAEYLTGNETTPIGVLDVPAKCGILSASELEITELDANTIASRVQNGYLKAADVATAFCKRAAIAQQLTQCLTEAFFDEGIERGKYLDNYLAEHGKPLGPLHGVPISIKECFQYKGVQTSIGVVSFLDRPVASQNSPIVDCLLSLGAILYCKTNIPQTMMSGDSHNNVFGRTLNPHKLSLGAGGSSGGEGALVAMKGSPLGVGTDVGGSIRIPAICDGTYGFKPSLGRVPIGGSVGCTRDGTPSFRAVAGPLANTFEDAAMFLKAVIESQPWNLDSATQIVPWRATVAESKPSKIRIGYYQEDPQFPVPPPVRRALETSAKALAAAGHEVIVLKDTPSIKTAEELCTDYWSMDNSKEWLRHINASGEPIIPSLQKSIWTIMKKPDGYTMDELFDVNALAGKYRDLWHHLWVDNKLDVILAPPADHTAVLHDEYGFPHYTALWNLLQWAACIIPVGKADKNIDTDDLASTQSPRKYRAEDVHGAPTTIQLVTRALQDEELVSIARVVDQVVQAAMKE